MFGAALGVSGAVFQSLLRNPLADPGHHRVLRRAPTTGALIVILVVNGTLPAALVGGALLGGMADGRRRVRAAYRRGVQGFRLIIVGIGVAAMLVSLNTWLILKADLDQAMSAAWGAGSLNGVSWDQVVMGGAASLYLLLAAMLSRPMRQMEAG